jgi:hypothetical protein
MKTASQRERDREKLKWRMRECSALREPMAQRLRGYSKAELLAEAALFVRNELPKGRHIPAVDRIGRRSRDGLICWFVMNYPEILQTDFASDVILCVEEEDGKDVWCKVEPDAPPSEVKGHAGSDAGFDLGFSEESWAQDEWFETDIPL